MIIEKIIEPATDAQIELLCRLGYDFVDYDVEEITVWEASEEIDKLVRKSGLKFYGRSWDNE